MRRLVLGLALAAILAGIAGFAWWNRQSIAAAKSSENGYLIATPARKDLRQVVECTGSVQSNRDVEIKSKASGQVITLPFDVSDIVKRGDLVIEIDPIEQQRNVQRAEASLAASRARLAQAEANLSASELSLSADRLRAAANLKSAEAKAKDARAKAERERALLDRKHSSVEETETAETTAVQAEQEIETARAALAMLKASEKQLVAQREDINLNLAEITSDEVSLELQKQYLSETKVVSPIDGIVSERNVQVGQIISSGISNVGGGTTILTISDLSRVFILASVDESRIGSVALNQSTEITADAFPGVQFTGNVVRIATKGVDVSNVITFEVKVEVTSANKQMLKPEMTANLNIIAAEKKQVLTVPAGAVVRGPNETYVTVRGAANTSEKVPVQIGVSDGVDTEILAGLSESDHVVWRKNEEDSTWRTERGPGMGGPPPPMM